jgi:hypothetical protein
LTFSDLRIDAADYLLFRSCPRSLHKRLAGHSLPARFPADEQFPVRPDRVIVQDLVRTLFPGGRELGEPGVGRLSGFTEAEHEVLFHACCGREPFIACADVLHPQKPEGFGIVLARETTSIKDSHMIEAAFLLWNFRRCEVPIRKLYIYHLEKQYERTQSLDSQSLFSVHDVTRRAEKRLEKELPLLREFEELLGSDPTLTQFAETQCSRPHQCPVCSTDRDKVSGTEKAPGDLSTLFKGGRLVRELREEGYATILDVPESRLSDRRHRVQHRALTLGEAQIDHGRLTAFLESLVYPLHFLDFEATSEPIPRYSGTKPWEHVAYLFSLHQKQTETAELTHTDFVMTPGEDERREMIEYLLSSLGSDGSVIVYSAGFEKGVLNRLAGSFPEHAEALRLVTGRIVDLLEPFTDFAYYHHEQRGKLSLKRVLPLLTSESYQDERVADGYTANVAFRYLTENSGTLSEADQTTVLNDLRSYCRMDTRAMVAVIESLRLAVAE